MAFHTVKLLRPAAYRASFDNLLQRDAFLSDSTSTKEAIAFFAKPDPQQLFMAMYEKLITVERLIKEMDLPQKFHLQLQDLVQAMREIHDRTLPSLCVLLPVPDEERTWAQWFSDVAISSKTYGVHFLCEYDPRHHCAIDFASDVEVAACESGKHLTAHAGYPFTMQSMNPILLAFLRTAHSIIRFVQGPARLMRVLGLNVDEMMGDLTSSIATTCQRALQCDELMQYVKPALDKVGPALTAAADAYSQQKEVESLRDRFLNLFSAGQQAQVSEPSAAAAAADSAVPSQLDGTSLVKLWAEIDPEQECRNVSANGIAQLFPTAVRDVRSGTVKVYFYCREHRDFHDRHTRVAAVVSADAAVQLAADQVEREIWFTQGLSLSRAASAQCQVPAVLKLRAENELVRNAAEAAANLAACEAAERDEREMLQRAADAVAD